jgi:hypothetical protein
MTTKTNTAPDPEEGDPCPECKTGTMIPDEIENCACHINPPCSACTDNPLICNNPDCDFILESLA